MQTFLAGVLVKLLESLTGKFVFFVSKKIETLADNKEIDSLTKAVQIAATNLENNGDKERFKKELIDASRRLAKSLEL